MTGCRVRFEFEHLEPITGTIVYVPVATGDAFVIHADGSAIDGIAERTVYIQNYARMTILP